MNTLPGEHYCKEHQGNSSHYDKCNCVVCLLKNENAALRAEVARWQRLCDEANARWNEVGHQMLLTNMREVQTTARAEKAERELAALADAVASRTAADGTGNVKDASEHLG